MTIDIYCLPIILQHLHELMPYLHLELEHQLLRELEVRICCQKNLQSLSWHQWIYKNQLPLHGPLTIYGLRMRRKFRKRFPRHRGLAIPTCITARAWRRCIPGSLTSGFLWSRWRGKRSRHSRRIRNPQFYVSGNKPMKITPQTWLWQIQDKHLHVQHFLDNTIILTPHEPQITTNNS